jgi:hypothetical protein
MAKTVNSNSQSCDPKMNRRPAGTRSGGPRTTVGKNRSKLNARKYGIFSKLVVLEDESRVEFDVLWDGLRHHFRPVGAFEEILVELLAATWWRLRRPLIAEAAEIAARRAFLEWDTIRHQIAEARNFPMSRHSNGLVREIDNLEALDACLVQLGAMKTRIENEGLDFARDKAVLAELYGRGDGHWQMDVHYWYRHYAETAALPEDIRKQKGLPCPEKCKSELVHDLDEELQKLRWYKDERNAMQCKRPELEALRRNVPDSPTIDRRSTTLERSFDRTSASLMTLSGSGSVSLGLRGLTSTFRPRSDNSAPSAGISEALRTMPERRVSLKTCAKCRVNC